MLTLVMQSSPLSVATETVRSKLKSSVVRWNSQTPVVSDHQCVCTLTTDRDEVIGILLNRHPFAYGSKTERRLCNRMMHVDVTSNLPC
jgi:hypothetical protein